MKSNKEYHLTPEGLDKLTNELKKLKQEELPRVLDNLKEARAQGDLSENAEYDAARDEQAILVSRIKELEDILKNSVIIDPKTNGYGSNLGKVMTIKFENGEVRKFTLVGKLEANPLENMISNESPVGSAVLYAKVGEEVSVKTDRGNEFSISVVAIED